MRVFITAAVLIFSCFKIILAQPSLEYVNFYSEGNPSVYGQQNSFLQVNPEGEVYQIGTYGHSISLTGLTTHSNSQVGRNAYIAKYDKEGEGLWSFKLETGDDDVRIFDSKIDSKGNLLITGRLDGRVDFDPGIGTASVSTPGNPRGFIVKYDPDGNYIWHQSFGSTSWHVYGEGLAIDENDNVYVTGDTGNVLSIGGTTISASAPSLFIARFDTEGELDWVESYVNVYQYTTEKIAISGGKVTVVTGFSTLDFDLGPGVDQVFSTGDNDIIIAQVDKHNGKSLKLDYFRRGGKQYPTKVIGFEDGTYTLHYASYSDDNEYRSGSIYSNADSRHNFHAPIDSFALTGFDIGANDELYVSMSGRRTVAYNPVTATIEFSGDPYSYLRKISPNGERVWQHKWYSTKGQTGVHMHVSDENEIYLTGTFIGRGDFQLNSEEEEYNASRDIDGFLVKWKDCSTQKEKALEAGCAPVVYDQKEYFESGIYIIEDSDAEGCLSLIELEVRVHPVDSTLTIDKYRIESGQQDNFAYFTWRELPSGMDLGISDDFIIPDAPGQYQYGFKTIYGCEFESPILTFPEDKMYRSSPFRTFGQYVHLLDDKILVNGKYNYTSTVEEYGYNSFGNQIIKSKFGYSGEDLGKVVLPFKGGALMNSDENILRYYNRPEGDELEFHSEIIPADQPNMTIRAFGEGLATYKDFVFIGAPLSDNGTSYIENGIIKVYKIVNETWQFVANMRSPNNGDNYRFGESIVFVNDILCVSEPGYSNEKGEGRIHLYDLSSWDGAVSPLTDPLTSIVSTEQISNISNNMAVHENSLFIRNDNQIMRYDFDEQNIREIDISSSEEYQNISNMKVNSGKLVFVTPDATFLGSNQLHLFKVEEELLQHEITIYPYSQNSSFGISYDLDEAQLVIGAPTYFDGEDEDKLGKVVKYSFEGLVTSDEKPLASNLSFTVFPNPTNGIINVNFDQSIHKDVYFSIIDLMGAEVARSSKQSLDLNMLNSGIYLLSIYEKGKLVDTQKIVKIN